MVISGSNPSGICHLGRQTTRKPAGVIGVQEDGERLRGLSTTLDLTQFCFKMTQTEKPNGRAGGFVRICARLPLEINLAENG